MYYLTCEETVEGTDDDGPTDGTGGDSGRSCCCCGCNLGCRNWNDHNLHLHSCSEKVAAVVVEADVDASKL